MAKNNHAPLKKYSIDHRIALKESFKFTIR
jgi:hypothetical protein